MTAAQFDLEPRCQRVQRMIGERGRNEPRQHAHAERPRTSPRQMTAPRLGFQDGEIKADGVTDDDLTLDLPGELRPDI